MNKLIKLSLVTSMLIGNALYASTTDNSAINIYGAGEKISDKSYSGVGLQYENDFSDIVLEKGSDYSKASGVLKLDINNDFYSKVGIGYLKREILINSINTDVVQKTGGIALGYGDNENYNLELGHIVSKLSDALDADGYSRISYIEVLGMYKDFDTVGVYKNTNVYSTNYSDYSLDVGYYPIEDIRISAKYDSVKHDDDNYVANVGMKYTFDTNKWSPFFKASKNSSQNMLVAIEWSKKIQNKSLKMRDEFENAVGTSEIVAQSVAPDVFASKTTAQNNNAPTWTASSYNTGLTVRDNTNDAITIKDLISISSDNDGDAITYTIVSISVPHSNDQTAWNNSVYIDNGVLKVHNLTINDPDMDGTVTVTIKATAIGGSNNTNVSFTFGNTQ